MALWPRETSLRQLFQSVAGARGAAWTPRGLTLRLQLFALPASCRAAGVPQDPTAPSVLSPLASAGALLAARYALDCGAHGLPLKAVHDGMGGWGIALDRLKGYQCSRNWACLEGEGAILVGPVLLFL